MRFVRISSALLVALWDGGSDQVTYPWFESTQAAIAESLAKGQLAHALLISAAPGTGGDHLALALARQILCDHHELSPSCDCPSCRFFAVGSHPDFILIQREADSAVIKIAQIQNAVDALSKTAQRKNKVVVIQDAHTLNINAANALLKTLEEPAGDAYILLVSEESGRLMPTIKSRVQARSLRMPTQEQTMTYLRDHNVTELSDYLEQRYLKRPLQLLELVQGESADLFDQWLTVLTEKRNIDVLKSAKRFAKEDLNQLIEWWIELAQFASTSALNVDQALSLFIRQLYDLRRRIQSGSNPSKQLAIETLLMDWYRVSRGVNLDYFNKKPLEELLCR